MRYLFGLFFGSAALVAALTLLAIAQAGRTYDSFYLLWAIVGGWALVLMLLSFVTGLPTWSVSHRPSDVPLPDANRRRRLRLKQNGGTHTDVEWTALCARYNQRCVACGQRRPLTKDHVVPVVMGGSDGIENLQPLCRSCNSSKGIRAIDYRRAR